MVTTYDQAYWEARWKAGRTQWDVGEAIPPITHYFKTVKALDAAILIPGCGSAYEAQYLLEQGFKHITIIEIAADKVQELQQRFEHTPVQVVYGDFFNHEGAYDYIIEQTFFCALDPFLRPLYAEKMASLLKPEGKLIGVLFDRNFDKDEPPFGGNMEEYLDLFGPIFSQIKIEKCYNSIPARQGSELFIKLQR